MAECSFNYYDRAKPKFLSTNYVAEADCWNGWTVVHASCTASQLMDRRLSRVCSVMDDSSPSLVITCAPSPLRDLYQWKVLVISIVRWDNMMKSELNVCVLVPNTTTTGNRGKIMKHHPFGAFTDCLAKAQVRVSKSSFSYFTVSPKPSFVGSELSSIFVRVLNRDWQRPELAMRDWVQSETWLDTSNG